MYASMSSRLLTPALLVMLSGCTLIMQGRSQEVKFSSEPPGATFTVAGRTEVTPVTIPVLKNDYDITFQRDGYKEASFELKRHMSPWFWGSLAIGVIGSTVDVATGAWQEFDTKEVHVVLEPLPGRIVEIPVEITTDPAGAEILIENVLYGRTPRQLPLPWRTDEREKKVTFKLAGHAERSVALARAQGKLHQILEALPELATVRFVSKPEGARIRMGDRQIGRTPFSAEFAWKLGDPPRSVEVVLEGYHTEKREFTRNSNEVSVELKEVVEEIVMPLKIVPVGAKLIVDGAALPEGTKELKLAWSVSKAKHTLTVSHPGYTTKSVELKRENATNSLEVKLAPALPGNP